MKRSTVFCGLSVILAAGAISIGAEKPWIVLFDGKSLSEWTGASGGPPPAGWTVEDGALHRKAGGGDLFTAREFGDFEFEFEWKVAKGSNSGVKYRVQRFEGGGLIGPEYQILDDAAHGDGSRPVTSAGSLYALFAPSEDKELVPVGMWNASRIVSQGTVLEHWLNGKLIVKVDTGSAEWKEAVAASKFRGTKGFGENRRGRILLQDHGDAVWFRGLRIRELD